MYFIYYTYISIILLHYSFMKVVIINIHCSIILIYSGTRLRVKSYFNFGLLISFDAYDQVLWNIRVTQCY